MSDYNEIMELETRIFKEIYKRFGAGAIETVHMEFENKYFRNHQQEYLTAVSSGLTQLYIYDLQRLETKKRYVDYISYIRNMETKK